MTASSLRRSSQPISSPGGTTSANWRLPRLRHLSALPNASLTTISVRPASLRPATRLDPMNPAPPVTNNIRPRRQCCPPFAPGRPGVQLRRAGRQSWRVLSRWTGRQGQANGFLRPTPQPYRNEFTFIVKPMSGAKGCDELMSETPILIIPYMWIGDFVRCHTVVKLLKQRFPTRPIDVLTTSMVAPLLDYMQGVRKGVVAGLACTRLALAVQRTIARRVRSETYGNT